MQSTPTLKDTDPHDVFAIESLLHAHAEKAPPLAHDPAAPSVAPQVHVIPQISVTAPISQLEPTFHAPDMRDIQVENVRPSEIKVDGLKPPGERPMSKWVKRAIMALLGLCGAMAAAGWQHYGDQAKAMAAEWAPPFVLAALPSATRPAVPEQPSAPASRGHRNGSGRRATGGNSGTGSARTAAPPLLLLQRNRASCNRWRKISPR